MKETEILEVKSALEALVLPIDAKIKKATEAVEAGNAITSKLKDELGEMVEKATNFQAQLDAIQLKQSKQFESKGGLKSINEHIEEGIAKSVSFKELVNGNSKSAQLELKAVTVLTPTNAVQPGYANGFMYSPARLVHVREYMSSGPTVSNAIFFTQETAYTNAAAPVAEGGTKPQSDFTLTTQSNPIIKIATFDKLSTEMLADLPGLTGYISTRLPNKLKYIEDQQILFGTGVGLNLKGLTVGGAAYVPLVSFLGTNADYAGVLTEACLQVRQNEFVANLIVLNPQDYAKILVTKNTQGTYLLPNVFTGAPLMIGGVPVIENTAVPVGTFIVGDFANAAFLWDRQELALRFYEQDGVNVQVGLITIEMSERLCVTNYRPSAFVSGTFAAALTGTP